MATFVLVHGSWHGGWCYARVARLLRAAGHEVFTPTLTGMGERAHLAGLEINLDTHVRDIVNVLAYEDLTDVILCGHSYGGMVITGVAGEVGERIACLFYLDAFVPSKDQSFFDVVGPDIAQMFLSLAAKHDGAVPPIPASAFNVNEKDAAWVDAICVPQSLASFAQAVRAGIETVPVVRRTYVFATANGMETFRPFHERLKDDPAWTVHTVACGHDVMLDAPEALAEMLLAEVR
jgi:pimeloyl-ACP methyl ester carboxylesterase